MRQFISLIFSLINLLTFVTAANKVVVGYWTDWTASEYPTSAVPWDSLTHVNYAFALFDNKNWKPKIDNPQYLRELVQSSKPTNTKILVSFGGWTGSKYFSPMVADPTTRATFIANTVEFVKEYQIDGVDLDWEYPGRDGAEGNIKSPQDTANYLTFLKELRAALGSNILITAAVRVQPFDGPNGPLSDVSQFASVFDFINIMSYDINGPWGSETGPNGGLDYEPGKGTPLSVKQSTTDWNKAGIPKDKLVVGVPFYGYALGVSTDMSKSDSQYATITKKDLPSYAYNGLFKENILTSSLEANTANGWIRKFDKITKTPWLFNKNTNTFIAYDDPLSLTHKTEYVRCNGYRGAMVWALNHDYNKLLIQSLQNVHKTGPCNGIPDPTSTSATIVPPTSTTSPKSSTTSKSTTTSSAKSASTSVTTAITTSVTTAAPTSTSSLTPTTSSKSSSTSSAKSVSTSVTTIPPTSSSSLTASTSAKSSASSSATTDSTSFTISITSVPPTSSISSITSSDTTVPTSITTDITTTITTVPTSKPSVTSSATTDPTSITSNITTGIVTVPSTSTSSFTASTSSTSSVTSSATTDSNSITTYVTTVSPTFISSLTIPTSATSSATSAATDSTVITTSIDTLYPTSISSSTVPTSATSSTTSAATVSTSIVTSITTNVTNYAVPISRTSTSFSTAPTSLKPSATSSATTESNNITTTTPTLPVPNGTCRKKHN